MTVRRASELKCSILKVNIFLSRNFRGKDGVGGNRRNQGTKKEAHIATMSTRTIFSVNRARETLVRLLFPSSTSSNRNTRYSYAALRDAYLIKVHELHPDKIRHEQVGAAARSENGFDTRKERNNVSSSKFIELKNAWDEYDKIIKLNKLHSNSNLSTDKSTTQSENEASFTLFGVGCSFADSPSERNYRNEIMEQACRGWFSSGSLAVENKERTNVLKGTIAKSSSTRESGKEIVNDDLFVEERGLKCPQRKSLVQNLDKFNRR